MIWTRPRVHRSVIDEQVVQRLLQAGRPALTSSPA